MVLRSMRPPRKPRPKLRIEYVAPAKIRPRARNPRHHSDAQIGKLMAAIEQFGFVVPILVAPDGEVIAGHGRLEAAKRLGLAEIPVIRLRDLSPGEVRALVIADNQLAACSEWDDKVLNAELETLYFDETLDFAPTITGFESAEVDARLFASDFGKADPADNVPVSAPNTSPISKQGDVWRSEDLTLVCGSALDSESYHLALGGEAACLAVTDPPYNRKRKEISGNADHHDFVQGAGEFSEEEFVAFLTTALKRLKDSVAPGALIYSFMDGAHLFELLSAARAAGLAQKAFCTWGKSNAGMGSFYRSQTEHVLVLRSGEAPHTNNIQLGRFGRNRSTLWLHPGMNSFGRDRDAALKLHATTKPIALLADILLDASPRGGLVIDPFAGSGSTLLAAHRVGRRAAGIELDPIHVDGALARIATVTGLDWVRDSDGARWSDLVRQIEEPQT